MVVNLQPLLYFFFFCFAALFYYYYFILCILLLFLKGHFSFLVPAIKPPKRKDAHLFPEIFLFLYLYAGYATSAGYVQLGQYDIFTVWMVALTSPSRQLGETGSSSPFNLECRRSGNRKRGRWVNSLIVFHLQQAVKQPK